MLRKASQPMARPAVAPASHVTPDHRSCRQTTLHFHCAFEICQSQSLAHMLDSLVRVSRRAARDDAKAEPNYSFEYALAVAQSFANDSIAPQTKPAVALAKSPIQRSTATVRKRRPPSTALWITVGNKTAQRSPDLSMSNKGKRSVERFEPIMHDACARTSPAARHGSRLFVQRHASHVRLIPYWQLHGLFDSLFRVLFNFPSLYLLTIGLVVIFSFRWSLPPA